MSDLELPVSPSWYMSHTGYPWELREDVTWYFNGIPMSREEAHEAAPFIRMEERYTTASEALDRASEVLHEATKDETIGDGAIDRALDNVKTEFDELYHE